MSDRTDQALANLTYEVITVTLEQLQFYKRLNQVAPTLVSHTDIQLVEKRLNRLQNMFKSLQQSKD